eukprot:CAMPEP_0202741174 /NCGR_PEP_ID=MMETSP1388-20130828/4093_1 /ASSEMBLY_ACC=CAM_ASM_000864 /TAXON_ID=37098 /ORGANISM="Isochrysis sp, Strain CCMP1244" /LENGTH=38 /DNA_ID= /DNA_START= /DNA_END= /DNA_ORIENTATION=
MKTCRRHAAMPRAPLCACCRRKKSKALPTWATTATHDT